MNLRPLIILAHADDESLGCGGLLARYPQSIVIILSDGRITVRSEIQNNSEHLKKACHIFKVRHFILDLPDQFFESVSISKIVNKINDIIDQNNIDFNLVVTHSYLDINHDHVITNDIARVIARPKNKAVSLLYCEIPDNSFWSNQYYNFYIDLDKEHLDKKIKAIKCYKNELMEFPHPNSLTSIKTLAQIRGQQSGFKYAEAYQCVRWCL